MKENVYKQRTYLYLNGQLKWYLDMENDRCWSLNLIIIVAICCLRVIVANKCIEYAEHMGTTQLHMYVCIYECMCKVCCRSKTDSVKD